jgi:hypothetical protein
MIPVFAEVGFPELGGVSVWHFRHFIFFSVTSLKSSGVPG